MATRLWSVVIDCAEPAALARWWAETLGWELTYESADEVEVEAPGADHPFSLVFGPVPEPKVGKNRVHLDVASRSTADQEAIVGRLLHRGATLADIGQADVAWTVMADPEGNEFCVLDPRDRYRDAGPLAAIVVDAVDPAALAGFWAAASGWSIGYVGEDVVSLHRPGDRPPDVDFVRVGEPHTVKNRVHLDVAPGPSDDRDAEVARLVALGARPLDVGQGPEVTWVVLADPEGNELCVLRPR